MKNSYNRSELIHTASSIRGILRVKQASRVVGDFNPVLSTRDILLDITWRVIERLSGERLPR